MIVEIKVVGSTGTDSDDLAVPLGTGSLRELIVLLVRHELASYEQRRTARRTLRVLTSADLTRGADVGSYGREVRAVAPAPAEDQAIERALEAFSDGLYFVFVDDVQVECLDAPLAVRPDSTLSLVRLVALAGG